MRVVQLKGELEAFLLEKHFELGQKFQNKGWGLLFYYSCGMMTALNTLNESMQAQGHTMNDFADDVHAFKKSCNCGMSKLKAKKACFLSYFEQVN